MTDDNAKGRTGLEGLVDGRWTAATSVSRPLSADDIARAIADVRGYQPQLPVWPRRVYDELRKRHRPLWGMSSV